MAKTAATRQYSYSLWYHPADSPTTRECPNEQSPGHATEAARDADMLQRVPQLEAQGYHVYRAERHSDCGRCSGIGEISIWPKHWRKRTPPPWFLHTHTTCPDCGGTPRQEG